MTPMSDPLPASSANFSSAAVGSEPADRMNSSGVIALDSLYEPCRSNGGGSMNLRPIVASTKSFTAGITLSGRKHRITNSFWKAVGCVPYSPGYVISCGCTAS